MNSPYWFGTAMQSWSSPYTGQTMDFGFPAILTTNYMVGPGDINNIYIDAQGDQTVWMGAGGASNDALSCF